MSDDDSSSTGERSLPRPTGETSSAVKEHVRKMLAKLRDKLAGRQISFVADAA